MFPIIRTDSLRLCSAAIIVSSLLFALATPARSQTTEATTAGAPGQWTWMGGSGASGHPGVYGTLGTPAAGNIPGSRSFAANWIDTDGNLWLFGGDGSDSQSTSGNLSDLWKYDISVNQWTWIGGSNIANQSGVYGTLGTAAPGNIPGARNDAAFWTDSSGSFWLFGGYGYDSTGSGGLLNDLWEYNLTANEWAWMGGSSIANKGGVSGTMGTPASDNIPGARSGAASWTDGSGNFWLASGNGYDIDGSNGNLSDMWEFNPASNQWTWTGGDDTLSCFSGCCDPGATPKCRIGGTNWMDGNSDLWLYGGTGWVAVFPVEYGDLSEFNPKTNTWTGEGGNLNCTQSSMSPDSPLICNYSTTYGTLGSPSPTNWPGSRDQAVGWTDASGNLWLFGGEGYDAAGAAYGYLNDLWEYNTSTHLWGWMGGSNALGQPGVYGTLGTPAPGNIPAGTSGGASTWVDHNGNFWLFGLDFWRYQPEVTPTVTLDTSSSTLTQTQDLTVNISVSGSSGTPTGTVTLTAGNYSSSTLTLSSGSASIVIPAGTLPAGVNVLVGSYAPDMASTSTYYGSSNTASITVFGFTVSASSVTITAAGVTSGNTATVTLTPFDGFTGSVKLTAAITSSPAGAQDLPTLSFGSTSPASITGASAITATLTVSTTAPTSSALLNPRNGLHDWDAFAGSALACLVLFAFPARRRGRTWLGLLLISVCVTCGITSCGGGSGNGGGGGGNGGGTGGTGGSSTPGTTPGNYTVTVTAASGTITSTCTFTVQVQ